jgi:EAL domain-containing protein (putative c-di-GMP-specific phosphodiesterase class I)
VKEILHDPIDREMVRSINEIGHLTGKLTIAEFAENAEIITMLRGMGVDFAQGYGIDKPKPVLLAVA